MVKNKKFEVTCIIVVIPSVSISPTLGTYGPATVEGGCLLKQYISSDVHRLYVKFLPEARLRQKPDKIAMRFLSLSEIKF